MKTSTIRETFLNFFAERGHTVMPSSPLVPDDPTLLFTTAGMVQFKPYFLGETEPPGARAASSQKCFRTTDLEVVGKTKRHMTFFEMLGNFSFGDYFKKEAIRWAWELVTEGFHLDPERLWATVYYEDDEAAVLWREEVGLAAERIVRRGREDNFWHMGVAGPCGPNTELLYDRGDSFGRGFTGEGPFDEERYLEVYNLVFMQFVQDDGLNITGELPKKGVDTGMGLERTAAILQDVPTVFEIDSVAPILARAEEVTARRYGDDAKSDVSLRVLAEHARGMTFLVADGVIPANEGRGYVLRRVIRRAVRYARMAGVEEPVLTPLVEETIGLFKEAYPEVARNRNTILKVVGREEERFDATLRQGLGSLEDEIERLRAAGERRLPGRVAFRLHDTYGFPLDLTKDIAEEEGLEVDLEEYDVEMQAQRERARAARRGGAPVDQDGSSETLAGARRTEFIGYEYLSVDSTVEALLEEMRAVPALEEGREGQVVLAVTPFYPEGGGQVGDRGRIETETGTLEVEDSRWGVPGVIVHLGRVLSGEILAGQEAKATVDPSHREGVRQSHTATHVLHWALRDSLGEHATQKGSLVEPGRLRFDFSHFERLTPEELESLEEELNSRMLFDDSVRAFETTYEYAMSIGAIALFGEKYGHHVRVVEVGDYSRELCGGTHVVHTGQVGLVKVVAESSVGAGIRRVEALTGLHGLRYLNTQAERLRKAAELLKTDPDGLLDRLEKTLATMKEMQTQLAERRAQAQRDEVEEILRSSTLRDLGPGRLVLVRRDGRPVEDLRRLAIALRSQLGSGLVIIGSAQDGSANLVAASSKDLAELGLSAATILSSGAALLGGSAGGKPDLAVAGGPNASEIDRAMTAVERAALEAVGGA